MKNIVLVCEASQLKELYTGLQKGDPNFKIIGFVNSDTENASDFYFDYIKHVKLSKLEKFIRKNDISEIVIASQNTETISVELYNKLLFFLENGVIIREYTQVYENLTQRIPVQYAARDFYKYFPFSRSNSNKLYLFTIRFFELFFSILGLSVGVAILPFLLLGNLFGNRGNLFYTQERIGKNGIPFKIYKLRSMVKNAESNGAVFATANDSRITPFGKFLRKSRLDEVPQFINVLKGDMAIIGPRPERAVFVQKIAEIMPFYHTRHVIKPGLTGWAQVNYSYGESIDDSLVKLQYDLYYIKHRSIFLDINIAIKTISTIVFYKGQ
jgi:lipopolysaccharide/colanic/teichoic acid biosynthesis glycosyltransferase